MNDDITKAALTVRSGEHAILPVIHGAETGYGCHLPENIEVQAGGNLEIIIFSVPASPADDRFTLACDIRLTGEGAECRISGAILCNGDDMSDIRLDIRHIAPGCSSVQSFRTIAAGNAKCSFHGKIIVSPGAQKTQAYQESHSVLLSDNAKTES